MRKNKRIPIKCKICDKDIKSYNKKRIYCSRKCYSKTIEQKQSGKKNWNWHGGKVKKICIVCGKNYFIKRGRIKTAKYCSVNCKIYSIKRKGKDNPAWKGGLTPIVITIRMSSKYKEWRQTIFIRDNFTCQKCGSNENIQAHHKKPFWKLLQDVIRYLPLINLYDATMLYTPFWNLENGITLCKKCHKKTKSYNQHTKTSKINNRSDYKQQPARRRRSGLL